MLERSFISDENSKDKIDIGKVKELLDKLDSNGLSELLLGYKKENQELKEKNIQMQEKVNEYTDKVDGYNRILSIEKWNTMQQVAKILNFKGMGSTLLYRFLKDNKILRWNNEAYQPYQDSGYFKLVQKEFEYGCTGKMGVDNKTMVSEKGIDFIRRKINGSGKYIKNKQTA